MGQRPSCCQDDEVHEVPKVEVVHHRQEAEIETSWKTCVPIDNIEDTSENAKNAELDNALATSSRTSRVSLAQCRLQRMDHLVVDRDILRGISLRETLNNAGRLWRRSPIDLDENERKKLWSRSRKVDSFDWFLSHTWLTPGRWKVLSLVVQQCWHLWLGSLITLASLAMVLCSMGILPMKGIWKPEIMGFTSPCPIGGWMIAASALAPVMGIGLFLSLPELCVASPTCFLDVVSIHQTDSDLMERGIYGLGGFLKVSKQLRILWSPPYFTRLWCVFEVAAFRSANPEGKISLNPLTIEIGITALFVAFVVSTVVYHIVLTMVENVGSAQNLLLIPALLPSYGAIRIVRRQSFMRRVLLSQLRNFDVDLAECRNPFDRHFIEAAILEWYGSKEKFAEYVRGPLQLELLRRITDNNVVITGYVMLALSAPVAAGSEWCLALWMGGAPWDVLLSRFVGMVIGTDFLLCADILMVTMLLCDLLAYPCCGFLLPDCLQTALIWFSFASMFAVGNFLGMAASNHSLWASMMFALACGAGACVMRLVTRWRLLRQERNTERVYGE